MTTKQLKQIETLAREGWCDAEIARRIEEKQGTVRDWRQKMGLPLGKRGMRHLKKNYTVYNRRTTEFVCEGTARECSACLGIQLDSFYKSVWRWKSRREGKYEIHEVDE